VFPGAVNCQNPAAYKVLCLPDGRRFEGLGMAAEPCIRDDVAANPGIHAARNRFYLGQFRHYFIVKERAKKGCDRSKVERATSSAPGGQILSIQIC
jgi:hypothetical protein